MTKSFGRLVLDMRFSSNFWTITQKNGTVYGPVVSFGWMREPSRLVPEGKKPFYAVQVFLGPVVFAAGIIL